MKKIFRSQSLVTSNLESDVFDDAFLAVDGSRIIDVGPWKKRPRSRDFKQEDLSDSLIAPSLFNLHTHLAMVMMRGVAEDVPLNTWLFEHIFPLEKKWVSAEFVKIGTELALCESIRNGVGFFADMYFHENEVADCFDRFGVRGIAGQSFFDGGGMDSKSLDESLQLCDKLYQKYSGHERVIPGLGPHAPYTCSQKTLRLVADISKDRKMPVLIHVAETKKELEDLKLKNSGQTPIDYVFQSGLFDAPNLLCKHSVWLEESDFEKMARPNVTAILNTQCNAKLASGFPPIARFKKHGVRFALGTDGAASNNSLDIFSEINFASKAYKLLTGDFEGFSAREAFNAATIRAAEAVGLDQKLGSLEPGKQADFMVINLNTAGLQPFTNAYSHLVYSMRGANVDSLYIAGKCLMKNRKIKITDEQKVIKRAHRLWSKMKSSTES